MSTLASHKPRLWSWQLSPFAAKVRVALAEKGLTDAVELIEVDPLDRPPRLRALNPSARVPTLELPDGTALTESTVICEWLEDTHPEPPLLPTDASARARSRALTRWVDDELTVPFFLSLRKEAFGLDPTDHPDVVAHLRTRLQRRWRAVERMLDTPDTAYLASDAAPTLADLSAIPLAVRMPQWKPELAPDPDTCPRTAAWLDRLAERPSAAAVRHRGAPPPAN